MVKSSASASKRVKQGVLANWWAEVHNEWTDFAKSRPGERFEDRYRRKRSVKAPFWKKFLMPTLGLLIIIAGLVLLPAPGPGIPVVMFGCAVLAERFLFIARFLDRCEPPLRRLAATCFRWWKHAPALHRWALAVSAGLLVLAACAVMFALVR